MSVYFEKRLGFLFKRKTHMLKFLKIANGKIEFSVISYTANSKIKLHR